jgi:hypothetical protein
MYDWIELQRVGELTAVLLPNIALAFMFRLSNL